MYSITFPTGQIQRSLLAPTVIVVPFPDGSVFDHCSQASRHCLSMSILMYCHFIDEVNSPQCRKPWKANEKAAVIISLSWGTRNGLYAGKKKMAPTGNECYNPFLFDGFCIRFICISFFGAELGD